MPGLPAALTDHIGAEAIAVTLSQQLSLSHSWGLLPIKDPLAREYYAEM
ncbi:hypothetical protein LBMAG46_20460 [Planctomycetia bacterium]|nr:hypothetical protein LBMAG46_20460 [Planctomycetia bacterium]